MLVHPFKDCLNIPQKFFSLNLQVMLHDLIEQATINIFTTMIWDDRCSSIWMLKEHMAAFLPDQLEADLFKNSGKFSSVQ